MNYDKNKPKFKLAILVTVLGVLFSPTLLAQKEVTETIKIEAAINPTGTLEFTNNSFDTQIKTWTNDYVELQMTVKLEGDKQDVDLTLKALRELCFSGSDMNRSINTKFWESITSNGFNHKMKLKNGDKVTLKKYAIENTLFIPKTICIMINNKYADIEMEDISGKAEFVIYSGKLFGGSVGGKTMLDLKYSKATLSNIPEATIKLYDSDIQLKNCGNFDIESKYSEVRIEKAGNMKFESYDDNYRIGSLGDIKGSAKYSDFVFGPSTSLSFNFYDSNLETGETGDVTGQSKYSKIVGKITGKLTLNYSYDDTYTFEQVESFLCTESKYSDFRFSKVDKEVNIVSYDDNMTVDKFSASFTGIKIESKYSEFIFTIPASVAYKLKAETKYGKLDFPEDQFVKQIYIKESESVNLEGHSKTGSDNTGNKIEIKSYDSKIIIRN